MIFMSVLSKEQLRSKITGFALHLGQINAMRNRINQFVLSLFKIVWRLAIILTIVFLANRYDAAYSVWGWVGIIGLIFGAQYFLYSITIMVTGLVQSLLLSPADTPSTGFQKFIWAFLLTNSFVSLTYTFLLSLIYSIYWQKPPIEPYIFALTVILINPLTIYVCQILVTLISWIAIVIFNKSQEARNPNAVIAALVVNALFLVENYPSSWTDGGFKSFISSLIERAAKLIQHALPKKLRSGDSVTDAWVKGDFAKIATAIRDMKRVILISNLKTNDTLANRLSTALEYLVTESYDQLEHIELGERPVMHP